MCIRHRQELHIYYLEDTDSGIYTCKAKNRLGSVQASIRIIAKGNLPCQKISSDRDFYRCKVRKG